MKSTLNIEFATPMEMCDFFALINPTINLVYSVPDPLPPPVKEFMDLKKEDVALEKQDDFERIRPAVIELIKEFFPLAGAKEKCDCKECIDLKMERVFQPEESASEFGKRMEQEVISNFKTKEAEAIMSKSRPDLGPMGDIGIMEMPGFRGESKENWTPTKTMGICADCGIPFTRLHNRVKWCDSCRSKKATAEASKKEKRSGRKSG